MQQLRWVGLKQFSFGRLLKIYPISIIMLIYWTKLLGSLRNNHLSRKLKYVGVQWWQDLCMSIIALFFYLEKTRFIAFFKRKKWSFSNCYSQMSFWALFLKKDVGFWTFLNLRKNILTVKFNWWPFLTANFRRLPFLTVFLKVWPFLTIWSNKNFIQHLFLFD